MAHTLHGAPYEISYQQTKFLYLSLFSSNTTANFRGMFLEFHICQKNIWNVITKISGERRIHSTYDQSFLATTYVSIGSLTFLNAILYICCKNRLTNLINAFIEIEGINLMTNILENFHLFPQTSDIK
jgi:hypothetical protein